MDKLFTANLNLGVDVQNLQNVVNLLDNASITTTFSLLLSLGIKTIVVKQYIYFQPSLFTSTFKQHWGKTEVIFSDFNELPNFKKQRTQIELFVFDYLEKHVNLDKDTYDVEYFEVLIDLENNDIGYYQGVDYDFTNLLHA